MDHLQKPELSTADEPNDPFFYGWRVVSRTLPDGSEVHEEVPLTEEDVLFPQEEDHFIQTPAHTRDFVFCHDVLDTHYATCETVVVTGDRRIDWCVKGIRPMGPDIVVFFDVHTNRRKATFSLARDGGRPVLLLEITSPSTRKVDVGAKIDLYYQAGVEKYIIVDRGASGEDPPRLRGYQRGETGWVPMEVDAEGRLDLAPVPFVIGLEDGRTWLYDKATGERVPDRLGLEAARQQAAEQTRQAEEQTRQAEEQTRQAEEQTRQAEEQTRQAEEQTRQAKDQAQQALLRAEEEARARAILEARLRDLEAKLAKQSGNGA